MLVNQDVNMNALVPEKHLTSHEQELITAIKGDPASFEETILEHEYTGKIDKDHVNDIVGAVVVSPVSKRLLFLKVPKKSCIIWFTNNHENQS